MSWVSIQSPPTALGCSLHLLRSMSVIRVINIIRLVKVALRASCVLDLGDPITTRSGIHHRISAAQASLKRPVRHTWEIQADAVVGAEVVDGSTNRSMDEGVVEACLQSIDIPALSPRAL